MCLNVRICDCSRAASSSFSKTSTDIKDRITKHSATTTAVSDTKSVTTDIGRETVFFLLQ